LLAAFAFAPCVQLGGMVKQPAPREVVTLTRAGETNGSGETVPVRLDDDVAFLPPVASGRFGGERQ
jgi:hypothetical protein